MIARSLKRRSGQGMTEYIILVGLIAILLVAVIGKFREAIRITIVGTANEAEDIAGRMENGGGGDVDDGGDSSSGRVRIDDAAVTDNGDGTYSYRGNNYRRVAPGEYEPAN